MRKNLKAVYENGVLRPLEPVDLEEHARVTLRIVAASTSELLEKLPDQASPADLETVRAALSKIPGSLAADVNTEREDR